MDCHLSTSTAKRLTSWRSAANAPDGVQNALMMLDAFVCCNGVLGHSQSECATISRREVTAGYHSVDAQS
jgi:hypothetical protein